MTRNRKITKSREIVRDLKKLTQFLGLPNEL